MQAATPTASVAPTLRTVGEPTVSAPACGQSSWYGRIVSFPSSVCGTVLCVLQRCCILALRLLRFDVDGTVKELKELKEWQKVQANELHAQWRHSVTAGTEQASILQAQGNALAKKNTILQRQLRLAGRRYIVLQQTYQKLKRRLQTLQKHPKLRSPAARPKQRSICRTYSQVVAAEKKQVTTWPD